MGNQARLYDILFPSQDRQRPLLSSATGFRPKANSVLNLTEPNSIALPEGFALQWVQDRADIDVSGPEFNFVRSIRVYDVRYARQHESGRDGDCN